jgi:hypothetical protein
MVALASQASFEEMAVSTSAAIEGVLSHMGIVVAPDLRVPAEDRAKAIDFFEHSGWNGNLVKRLIDFVKGLENVTASSRLHTLVEQGVITSAEFAAWKWIRNRLLHGTLPELSQQLIDNAHHVLTLFHRIVLHCIDFTGELRDYGEPNWPLVSCGRPISKTIPKEPAGCCALLAVPGRRIGTFAHLVCRMLLGVVRRRRPLR